MTTCPPKFFFLRFSIFILCLLFANNVLLGAEQVKRSAAEAWRARQLNCKSADVSIKLENLDAKYIHVDTGGDVTSDAGNADEVIQYDQSLRVVLEGSKMRLEIEGQRPVGEGGSLRNTSYIEAFDGNVSKAFSKGLGEYSELSYPMFGSIMTQEISEGARLLDLLPMYMIFLPMRPELSGFRIDDLEVSNQLGQINNAECHLLIRRVGKTKFEYWVDAAQNYSIVRYRYLVAGRTIVQIDIEYTLGSDTLFLPTSWRINRMDGEGKPFTSQLGTVIECKLNSGLTEDVFDLEFPVGTVVQDHTVSLAEPAMYLTREAGINRVITKTERLAGVPYEDLLVTESGLGTLNDSTERSGVFILVNVIVISVIVTLILRRKLKQV